MCVNFIEFQQVLWLQFLKHFQSILKSLYLYIYIFYTFRLMKFTSLMRYDFIIHYFLQERRIKLQHHQNQSTTQKTASQKLRKIP